MRALDELIARLENATGPDRELDAAIVVALDIRPDWLRKSKGELWRDGASVLFKDDCVRRGGGNPTIGDYAHYTLSIDAALTLVPEDHEWKCGYSKHVRHNAEVRDLMHSHKGTFVGENDSNRAIALCIAALKARNALTQDVREQS